MSAWMYWPGGHWTRASNAIVNVKLGDGRTLRNQIAGYLDWLSVGMTNSIVAYQIVESQNP